MLNFDYWTRRRSYRVLVRSFRTRETQNYQLNTTSCIDQLNKGLISEDVDKEVFKATSPS